MPNIAAFLLILTPACNQLLNCKIFRLFEQPLG